MHKFMVRYFFIGVLGSVAVFYGAPELRDTMVHEILDKACRSLGGQSAQIVSAPAPSRRVRRRSDASRSNPASPKEGTVPASAGRGRELRSGSGTSVEGVDHAALADQYIRAQQWSDALRECDLAKAADPTDPRLPHLRALAMAQGTKWGVVTAPTTACYDRNGKFLERVPAGTFVQATSFFNSESGPVALCTVYRQDKSLTDVLIRTAYLNLRPGPLSQASAAEKQLRARHAELLAAIDQRKSELRAARGQNNPHAKAYAEAKAAYKKLYEQVTELTAKRDASTETDHMDYADRLRTMKGEEIQRRETLEQAKAKYNAWQADHPDTGPVPTDDSQLASLRRELDTVASRIEAMEKGQ